MKPLILCALLALAGCTTIGQDFSEPAGVTTAKAGHAFDRAAFTASAHQSATVHRGIHRLRQHVSGSGRHRCITARKRGEHGGENHRRRKFHDHVFHPISQELPWPTGQDGGGAALWAPRSCFLF